MTNTILQITKVNSDYAKEIRDTFNHLPETDHRDGNYRLRRYSRVSVNCDNPTPVVTDLCVKEFNQSSKYNQHQGGMSRAFDNIDQDVINSECLREMYIVFHKACNLPSPYTMDIHQMRVRAKGGATQLSPEGWHQDGYDCIAVIGIDRCNIIGGELLLSTSKTDPPFLEAILDPGTMAIVDDSYLWHNGRSIQLIENDKPGYMDVLVFTAKKQ